MLMNLWLMLALHGNPTMACPTFTGQQNFCGGSANTSSAMGMIHQPVPPLQHLLHFYIQLTPNLPWLTPIGLSHLCNTCHIFGTPGRHPIYHGQDPLARSLFAALAKSFVHPADTQSATFHPIGLSHLCSTCHIFGTPGRHPICHD